MDGQVDRTTRAMNAGRLLLSPLISPVAFRDKNDLAAHLSGFQHPVSLNNRAEGQAREDKWLKAPARQEREHRSEILADPVLMPRHVDEVESGPPSVRPDHERAQPQEGRDQCAPASAGDGRAKAVDDQPAAPAEGSVGIREARPAHSVEGGIDP